MLGRGRRAPGALVDEQDVRMLGFDGLLEIEKLEARPLAELAQTRAERTETRPRPPVVGFEPLDLPSQRLRLQADRAETLDVVHPAAHRDAVTALRQLEQRRDQRIQPTRHRIHIRQDNGHRQPSLRTPLRGRAHALTGRRALRFDELEDPLRVLPDRCDVPEHPLGPRALGHPLDHLLEVEAGAAAPQSPRNEDSTQGRSADQQ